ncbi:competence protein ComEC [Clostridium algifaecis]|uniref:Competence protein ComEC n=1 Tax=Clostridium algifaecis TaxID=1472040 RepID=A0ABS4KX14_9CLOT|nr:ComEC/Rec2 family competence protein [Clostridium algifaecis]MBP2034160.1 competence protein ComEC [Clostridium algifaecis]
MNFIKKYFSLLLIIIISIFITSGCTSSISSNTTEPYNGLKVHYIDVGQGDSELIQVNGKNLLIDAGPNESRDKLMSYLKKQNIKKFDYVIATHPDEDHIGGMGDVIKKYPIDKFYTPKKIVNTKTFKYMIQQLRNKNMKIDTPEPGIKLDLGKNTTAEMLAPNSMNYPDTNNYSVVLKITYGNTKFLFTGDAEKTSESEIIDKGYDLSADVLKVGHHGSSGSTSQQFLDKVDPKIAIISCGKNNKYGHPHKKTINKLKKKNIQIYRTDVDGTIILMSNGSKISKNE